MGGFSVSFFALSFAERVDYDNHGWIWIPWAFFQSCLRAAFCHLISSSDNIVHGLLEAPVSNPFLFVCFGLLCFPHSANVEIMEFPLTSRSESQKLHCVWPRMWQKLNTVVLNLDINLRRLLEADELVCGEVMISDLINIILIVAVVQVLAEHVYELSLWFELPFFYFFFLVVFWSCFLFSF